MLTLLFIAAAFIYSLYAYLPFMNLPAKYHYPVGMVFSVLAGLVWVTISRNVHKDSVALYGAYFDMILTACFLAIPLLVNGMTLTPKQGIGIAIMLLGMAITKL